MKLVQKTILKGGFYSFLIILAILLFSHAIGLDDYGNYKIVVSLSLYLIGALCGYIVAAAELIFETELDIIIKRAVHFVSLLIAFIIIFAVSGFGGDAVGKKIFVAIVIYILTYVVLFLLFFAVKRIYVKVTGKLNTQAVPDKKNPDTYQGRFK